MHAKITGFLCIGSDHDLQGKLLVHYSPFSGNNGVWTNSFPKWEYLKLCHNRKPNGHFRIFSLATSDSFISDLYLFLLQLLPYCQTNKSAALLPFLEGVLGHCFLAPTTYKASGWCSLILSLHRAHFMCSGTPSGLEIGCLSTTISSIKAYPVILF